ncbi:lysophospholipid acyltransferase family protein [Nocardioides anomalus]|uniref:lysophospholipid acyltransferase family protein n=1 Tax=Nocardioides anomalus TaxID=2712223 RepID=UPI001E362144|nr:lysophospholipid acyltransferase family protein [Nocardioides anomalus]
MRRGHDLPPSARLHPARYLLHPLRPLARTVIRRRVKVRIVDGHKLPRKGGVIIACNHVGVADGPLLAIFAPRPVHALTKEEMFKGFMNRFLLSSGQIPLDRFHPDPLAVKRCLRVLRSGGVIGIFPEGARGGGGVRALPHRRGVPRDGDGRAHRPRRAVRHPGARGRAELAARAGDHRGHGVRRPDHPRAGAVAAAQA